MKRLILLSLLVIITIIAAGCENDGSGSGKYCGDGIEQTPNDDGVNEYCDEGSNNGGVSLTTCMENSPYNGVGNYCGADCKWYTCKGPYCGDGILNGQE